MELVAPKKLFKNLMIQTGPCRAIKQLRPQRTVKACVHGLVIELEFFPLSENMNRKCNYEAYHQEFLHKVFMCTFSLLACHTGSNYDFLSKKLYQ